MNLIVQKTSSLQGEAIPPGSKSHSIRGLLFALLAKGEHIFKNMLYSDDTLAALHVCKTLGMKTEWQNEYLYLQSTGIPLSSTGPIFTGNSGITTHFILPLLGLRESSLPILIDCGEQMKRRPIQSLLQALEKLGLHFQYKKEPYTLPAMVSGQLQGGKAIVDGITSQYISALLLSLPLAPKDSEIRVTRLQERPYLDMTLQWLQQQNIDYQHEIKSNEDIFYIKGGQCYHPIQATIPSDFSSASYLIAAAVLTTGKIILHGLNTEDTQGDKQLLFLLKQMGADITCSKDQIVIHGGKPLSGMTIDTQDIPDLVPTLAVIATQATGETRLYNAHNTRFKETDRIHSMTQGLRTLGAHIVEHTDGMTIKQSALTGASVQGFNDHRTVMALSIAGLIAENQTIISDGVAIQKTFPGYIKMMRSLGAQMELHHA